MSEFYRKFALGYFIIATSFLLLLAALLLLGALWELLVALVRGDILGILDSVGLVIIGFAIVETGKFIAEEEVLRDRELRSAVESRRSLTKFVTIIVIAASLEALVMIFEASRNDVRDAIYPAMLFAATMLGLVALGAFQWLSSRIAPPPDPGVDGGLDHRPEPPEPVSGRRSAGLSRRGPRSGGSGRRATG
jgi:hypothetical protein